MTVPCLLEIKKKTENSLNSAEFSTEDILKGINNLDSNKFYSLDEICGRMLRIWDSFICRLSQIIYKFCFVTKNFPWELEKVSTVPVHKKNFKQLVRRYRPISLLPICGKIFDRLLYSLIS